MFAFPAKSRKPGMTAGEAVRLAAAGEVVVIDIRETSELRARGKAAGALHVPMAALAMRCDPHSPECLPELAESRPVAVYCASGARTSGAVRMLERMGHPEVHNIGGLDHWIRAGGTVER